MGSPVPSRRFKGIHNTAPYDILEPLAVNFGFLINQLTLCLLWLPSCLSPLCVIYWWESSPSFFKASLMQGNHMQQTFPKNLGMTAWIRAQCRKQRKMQNWTTRCLKNFQLSFLQEEPHSLRLCSHPACRRVSLDRSYKIPITSCSEQIRSFFFFL